MYQPIQSKFLILLSLMLMAVTACSPVANPLPPSAAAPASADNTLTVDINLNDLITIDPAVVYEYSGILIVHNVYQSLVTFVGSDLQTISPDLADSWETKDLGDRWELTFNLHPGNKFASGNPITADDVVYSFNRVLAINGTPAFLFTDVGGLQADSVKAVDPSTVVINLPKTTNPGAFLAILTNTTGGVVDSKEVKAHETGGDNGTAWLLDHSAGSGPYVVDHLSKDVEVLLKANPNYGGTRPAIDSILISHVPESANQLTQLQKGDADLAMNLTAEQFATLSGNATTYKGADTRLFYVGMNIAVKPLDKVEVREALRMAVDYDGIVNDLLSGNAQKVQTIIPFPMLGFNKETPFQQDLDGAKALLQKAGVSNIKLEMLIPEGSAPGGVQWSDLGAKLISDWDQIGVTVTIKQLSFAELLNSYRAQKAQLALLYWGPDFADPDSNVTPLTSYKATSIAYRNSWDDAIATKAYDAALMTDPTARVAAYKEITEYVLHNGPYAVLYQPSALFGIGTNIKGFAWNPLGFADFWSISKSK